MIAKLIAAAKSRKFWLGIILYPALVVVNRKAHLGLTDSDLWAIVAGVGAWILGQSNVDAAGVTDITKDVATVAEKAVNMILDKQAPPADGGGPAPETK